MVGGGKEERGVRVKSGCLLLLFFQEEDEHR